MANIGSHYPNAEEFYEYKLVFGYPASCGNNKKMAVSCLFVDLPNKNSGEL